MAKRKRIDYLSPIHNPTNKEWRKRRRLKRKQKWGGSYVKDGREILNEVIDSLDMVKDIVDSNDLKSNIKLLDKKEKPKEKNKDAPKGDSKEVKEDDDNKKSQKDSQIKSDLEKIKQKDKNEDSNKIVESQKRDLDDF